MTDAMSKKEKLARGSAVIKVMRVTPRAGHFLKTFIDPRKLPRTIVPNAPKGVLAEMPWLNVKAAEFNFNPKSAKNPGTKLRSPASMADICGDNDDDEDPNKILGLPDGDKMLGWFNYRTWQHELSPTANGNVAEHFNVMLGLLISMAQDCDNENFADVEAYPCVQFLRTIKSPNGETPYNIACFISYIEYVCQKHIDEG